MWNEPYADRMLEVYEDAPGDPDVATLCADALMNLTPGSCGTCAPAAPPTAPAPWRPRRSSTARSPPRRAPGTPASSICTST
ncbi:hypothetical protein SHKM778_52360 [Streptomyces sp. KM77-8]|uniref:Uncharacterized protein n=1 Tax=Streptomyces haneummycinicus TaxID=3074435 RepID=A0AAT9HNE4_9ACTN